MGGNVDAGTVDVVSFNLGKSLCFFNYSLDGSIQSGWRAAAVGDRGVSVG